MGIEKPKKIRKEHLDESLILWIEKLLHSGLIEFNDLSQSLKDIIKHNTPSGSGYNDSALVADIEKLKTNKLDKTEAETLYRKISNRLNLEDMNDEIQKVLKSVKWANVAFSKGVRLSDTPIEMNDLDPSIQNLISGTDTRINALDQTAAAINRAIVSLNNKIGGIGDLSNLTNSIATLRTEIASLRGNISNNADALNTTNTKVSEAFTKITALEATVNSSNNVQLINGKLPDSTIPDSVTRKQDLKTLEDSLSAKIAKQNPVDGSNGLVATIKDSDNNRAGGLFGCPLSLPAAFCDSTKKQDYISKNVPVIIVTDEDLAIFKSDIILYGIETYNKYDLRYVGEALDHTAIGQTPTGNIDQDDVARQNYPFQKISNMSQSWALNQRIFFDVISGESLINHFGTFISLTSGEVRYQITNVGVSSNKKIIDEIKAALPASSISKPIGSQLTELNSTAQVLTTKINSLIGQL